MKSNTVLYDGFRHMTITIWGKKLKDVLRFVNDNHTIINARYRNGKLELEFKENTNA